MSPVSNARKSDPTNLTDEQCALIEPLIPGPKNRWARRPRTLPSREVVNTILYLNRTVPKGTCCFTTCCPKAASMIIFPVAG